MRISASSMVVVGLALLAVGSLSGCFEDERRPVIAYQTDKGKYKGAADQQPSAQARAEAQARTKQQGKL